MAAGNAIRALGFKAKPLLKLPVSAPESDSAEIEASEVPESIVAPTSESMPIKVVKESSPSIHLDLAGLSKRVGLSYQKISSRRKRSDFTAWISEHDPDGHGWEYSHDRNVSSAVAPV